jgi:hypothetical protein
MGVYTYDVNGYKLKERHLYGSGRLGMSTETAQMIGAPIPDPKNFDRTQGLKQYEISNHLGNVLTVVTDRKAAFDGGGQIDHYNAEIVSATDYYPFGVAMAGRVFSISSEYRFGFNTQEHTNELNGESHYTAKYWEYDSRLARRWNLDPKPQINVSDYACMANSPLYLTDWLGDEVIGTNKRSARRMERNMKKETFSKPQFAAFRKLIKRDGNKISSIDPQKFMEAVKNLDPQERALAEGYFDVINSPDKYFVNIVKRAEKLDTSHPEMNSVTQAWGVSASSLNPDGASVDTGTSMMGLSSIKSGGGSLTYSSTTNNQVLIICVMNPINKIGDFTTWSGSYSSRTTTLGEKLAHEMIGHGYSRRLGITAPALQNVNAIQLGNLFLQVVYSKGGLFRDGSGHGGSGRVGMSRSQALSHPIFLDDTTNTINSIKQAESDLMEELRLLNFFR